MTSPSQGAEAHQARQQLTARYAANIAQRAWQAVDLADLTASWSQLLPGVRATLTAAQTYAALQADRYIDDATPDEGPSLVASAFSGTAADGRPLDTLLALPVVTTKRAIAAGQLVDEALGRGLAQLVMTVQTEVADAGRTAAGVAVTARPQVRGYVRVVSPPACGRCIILAGRMYRWSDGFQRHPRCDCTMQPVADGDTVKPQSPEELFAAMDSSEQERAFTVAGAKAIRDGADPARVVNARRTARDVYEVDGREFTREATTARGRLPGQAASQRLTPQQIYREAGDDRAEAIRLLRRFGYIT